MESSFTHRWIRKFRILTFCLIFSGALNIGAIAVVLTFFLQERKDSFSYPPMRTSAEQRGDAAALEKLLPSFGKLSFRELAALLANCDFVEDGYRKRDLALSALVSKHHFHLERALGGMPAQMRSVEVDGATYSLFPGMTDEQFQALIRFAYLEKWPLSAQGLFSLMQKSRKPRDASLEQAFILSVEFRALSALFQKCEIPAGRLIDLICQGSWQLLESFVQEQSQTLDLSEERRRRFLLSYLAIRSEAAAALLVQTDCAFALKRLDDAGVAELLDSMQELSPAVQRFCAELLLAPRSDLIWHKSAALLYRAKGVEPPQIFDRAAALAAFSLQEAPPPPAPAAKKMHVVKDGETLWKIARLYKVKIDRLSALNALEKETIVPGMLLQIPD